MRAPCAITNNDSEWDYRLLGALSHKMGVAATHPAKCEQEGWQQHTLVIMSKAMRVAATHPKSE